MNLLVEYIDVNLHDLELVDDFLRYNNSTNNKRKR